MAVYTEVSEAAAQALLDHLHLGPLQALSPIEAGIENTNYFVTACGGRWVLTLFERLSHAELPFYLGLMRHLAQQGLPVPAPCADAAGHLVHTVAGKPAALVQRLGGRDVVAPDAAHCHAAGAMAALLHMHAVDFALAQPNARGADWREATATAVQPWLTPAQAALLQAEVTHQRLLLASAEAAALPQGPVHADMFRDNVLFESGAISGVIDFYFAGVDHWLFDLAVCLNDWCVDMTSGRLNEALAQALTAGYAEARARLGQPVTGLEWRLLPSMRRLAALRFWLSRLADWHMPREASLLRPKDPAQLERVLRQCVEQPWHPQEGAWA
ncbi:MAG: homoserine kinase [Proteobacteria bacterium]|nr:homoserine kinase [Pseudomonadota bacterium]